MIASVLGLLGTAAAGYLAGDLVGVMLSRLGLGGFGPIAASVLRDGKLLRLLYRRDPTEKARSDLKRWIDEHDPAHRTAIAREYYGSKASASPKE